MSTYVMSDIHGNYEKYCRMLEKIHFSDADELFVLGDVVDRGPQPMALLLDMMNRANVFPLYGNHDLLALDMLRKLNVETTEETNTAGIEITVMNELLNWLQNGGQTTIDDFRRLDAQKRKDVIGYLTEFSLYEVIDVGDKTFILVHAGLGNFRKGKKLREYTVYELVSERNDPDRQYYEDDEIYIVSGHTPTPTITGRAEIYHSCHNICIDCGVSSGYGRLGCLCLDTMEEFYVQ